MAAELSAHESVEATFRCMTAQPKEPVWVVLAGNRRLLLAHAYYANGNSERAIDEAKRVVDTVNEVPAEKGGYPLAATASLVLAKWQLRKGLAAESGASAARGIGLIPQQRIDALEPGACDLLVGLCDIAGKAAAKCGAVEEASQYRARLLGVAESTAELRERYATTIGRMR